MRLKHFTGLLFGLLAWLTVGESLAAADQTNPYQSIVDRNAFGLREPPPPQQPPPPPPPPPVVRPTVKLKGWTSLFSKPRALLQITEQGEKPQNMILSENERQGEVEVKAIDMEKNEVTLSISGFVTNVTFAKKEDKAVQPVAGNRRIPPAAAAAAAAAAASSSGPTVVSRNSSRGSVKVLGGSAPAVPTPPPAASYNAAATAANRLRSLPSRSIRTTPKPSSTPAAPALTREQTMILIEAQKATRPDIRSILPPTPYSAPDQ